MFQKAGRHAGTASGHPPTPSLRISQPFMNYFSSAIREVEHFEAFANFDPNEFVAAKVLRLKPYCIFFIPTCQ